MYFVILWEGYETLSEASRGKGFVFVRVGWEDWAEVGQV